MVDMFIKADEILHHSVKGITDLIIMPGHVNLDFADVRTVMLKAGKAMMGIGIASGENRAVEAAERAISHPLLEDISVSGAKAVLMNITSSSDLTMDEMTEASDKIYQEVGEEAEIIWGQAFDDELGDEIRITVIATGIGLDETSPDDTNIHRLEDVVHPISDQPVEQEQKERIAAQSELTSGYQLAESNGGYTRNPTREELANWNEYDNPVIVKQEDYRNKSGRFDNEDLEVPTFLRRKAD